MKKIKRKIIKNRLITIADAFDRAKRSGIGKEDKPEGAITITMSDTLAKQLSIELRDMASKI
jgi:hypothetical protein